MNPPGSPRAPLRIRLAAMSQSPFNRSIWTGFAEGFESLGHHVEVVDAASIPEPGSGPDTPHLLLAIHGSNASIESVQQYRAAGIHTAVYLLDEPYEVDRTTGWARYYDTIFSVDRITVPVHAQNTQAHFLPLGYNDAIFNPDGPAIPSDILVLGSPFSAREQYLGLLRDRWGDRVTWVGPGWKAFSPAGTHVEQFVNPVDCARFYRGAGIVINIHRDSFWSHFGELNSQRLEATHLNPRFWEAAACRTVVLTSYRKDLDVYAPRAPSFSNLDEYARKLEYLLDNPSARRKTAERLYGKVRKHSYRERCSQVLKLVQL